MMLEFPDLEKVVFDWNEEKNLLLKEHRNITFENIVYAIKNQQLLDIITSPSPLHKNQSCFIVCIDDYIYLVPFVKDLEKIFLKTIYKSRKHKKFYLTN